MTSTQSKHKTHTQSKFNVQLIDNLSHQSLALLNQHTDQFSISTEATQAHAMLLRSTNLHQHTFPDTLEP